MSHRRTIAFIAALISIVPAIAFAAPACAEDLPPEWTVMVYMDGDNDLEASALVDLAEMAASGPGTDVNIVVLLDTLTGPAELLLVRVMDKVREEQGFLVVDHKILVAGRVVVAAVTCWDSCLGEVGHFLDRLHTELLLADHNQNFEGSGCRVHHTSGYLEQDILVDRTEK